MKRIEKTVFISYRRANVDTARAIYLYLTQRGFDVFFDFITIKAGDFEQVIFGGIESRAHFIPILTPSALERCNEPNDMVRREIEHALKHQRNIIPLTYEGFDFFDIPRYLPPEIAQPLARYNGLRVPMDFFDEAMERLIKRLETPLEMVLHPPKFEVRQEEARQHQAIMAEPTITIEQLTAQEYFERGNKHWKVGNWDYAIDDYSQAIRLKPDYAFAYNNRGNAKDDKGNTDGAIQDYNQAIRLKPDYANAYYNRGNAKRNKGDTDGAIQDYNQAIRLNPDDASAYYNRGFAKSNKGDYDGAIQDYNQAIRLKPDYANAYINRGVAKYNKGDTNGAIQDYNQAIRLKPDYALAYNNRGTAKDDKRDYDGAIQDYEQALRIDPNNQMAKNNLANTKRKRGY